MNKKFFRLGAGILSVAVSAGALMMFAGCTSTRPEVRITYVFNDVEYAVDYELSRTDAPRTVTHFIELADAGFYNGMCVHDYTDEHLLTGGFRLRDENNQDFDYDSDTSHKTYELYEVDYFKEVEKIEKFTQSVWWPAAGATRNDPQKGEGTYTVYNESAGRVNNQYGRDFTHTRGALVFYTTDKGAVADEVVISRADNGKGNDGNALEYQSYVDNSATSLFYTYTGSSTALGEKYCVFGMAKDYEGQLRDGLLKAIDDYIAGFGDDEDFSFTTTQENYRLNTNEPIEALRKGDIYADFETPMTMPIIIKSVKVTKY